MSDAMKSLPNLDWIRKGSPLPKGVATARLAANPSSVLARERVAEDTDIRDWLGGSKSMNVCEEAIGLGSYGKVLTVLTSDSSGQSDDIEDEESDADLIESWTPRFHK